MTNYVEHYEKRDYIYPLSRKEIFFKLKTNIENVISINFIYFEKIRKRPEVSVEMSNFNSTGSSPYFFGNLEYEETIKYIDYYFKITTEKEILYYSPEGLKKEKPIRSFCYSDTNHFDVFMTPTWAKGLIGYEIFPDRFNIGDEAKVKNQSEWKDIPTRENFFGGNIKGITEKIDYLKSLNIGLLYLTPIFKAESNHKYDTIDYLDIDPGFGTKEDFKTFVDKLHDYGIRIIIDGVFNHIGYYSVQFQDALNHGKDSKYYNWFYIYGDTVDTENINYECVGYHKWMPKLRYETKEVREHIKAVGRYWVDNFKVDGFRLDVSDEVDYTFWQEFRKTIKSSNEETILIGETWKNGSDLLRGDTLDSIMNYRLRDALLDFIVYSRINLEEFKQRVESIYFDYPKQTHDILYNLLGSHDTERIITLCKDDKELVNLLVSILFALPGIPFIYYGDELGMTGENDPLSRKAMDWTRVNNQTHLFHLEKINKRTACDILKYGDFVHVDMDDDIYSFKRTYNGKSILFVANVSNKEKHLRIRLEGLERDIALLPKKSEIIEFS